MALISTRNLVAPLTNKVHLTSLVLLAVAFAALRFAGGSVSVEHAGGKTVRGEESRRAPVSTPEQTRNRVNALRDSIGTMGQAPPEARRETPPPQQQQQQQKKPSGGLADVERQLGL